MESGFGFIISSLNDYTLVPVQEIIGLNPDNMDSIGNMKVQIEGYVASDDYLNVRFMLNFPSPQKPILNLVVNEMIPWTKDGYGIWNSSYNNNGSQGRLVHWYGFFKLGDYSLGKQRIERNKGIVNPWTGRKNPYFLYPLTGEGMPPGRWDPLELTASADETTAQMNYTAGIARIALSTSGRASHRVPGKILPESWMPRSAPLIKIPLNLPGVPDTNTVDR